jgi:signal transduction histidine kinase
VNPEPTGLGFSVDTQLFRELGELLVGRDSTALVELIKNSYDADATTVTVYGEHLDDPNRGVIRVSDNGSGMTEADFKNGFLRIASRMKVDGDRYSSRLRRRYTGAKGIGRLAAHKLARVIEVETRATGSDSERIVASIDWDAVEQVRTFDLVHSTRAIQLGREPSQSGTSHGTTITLRRLRRKWTPSELARFVGEVQLYSPPRLLVDPVERGLTASSLLIERPDVRDSGTDGAAFDVELMGEFDSGDDYWVALADAASWIVEIDCRSGARDTVVRVSPTDRMLNERPWLGPVDVAVPRSLDATSLAFQSRIFVREGALKGPAAVRTWGAATSGIRIYMEGFRVLPYGEPGNDWLEIDAEYTRRRRVLSSLKGLDDDEILSGVDEGLSRLPAQAYLGGVFLRERDSAALRMLVNREGFVPDAPFLELTDITRTAIDILTRVRAASSRRKKELESEGKLRAVEIPESNNQQPEVVLSGALASAARAAAEARSKLASSNSPPAVLESLETLDRALSAATVAKGRLDEDRQMTLVLASVGLQMSSFNHEVIGLVGMARAMETGLEGILRDDELAARLRRELTFHLRSLGDLRRSLERQASYLVDIVSLDSRRRRSRQKAAEIFGSASRLFGGELEKRAIDMSVDISDDLRTPAMFKAELVAVFSNLLSNAIKAAGSGGVIRASGRRAGRGGVIRIENTGTSVSLSNSERWFRPFESTTAAIDPALGQGMGLGLPITRALLESYSSTIKFVDPSDGFATAIELEFPS